MKNYKFFYYSFLLAIISCIPIIFVYFYKDKSDTISTKPKVNDSNPVNIMVNVNENLRYISLINEKEKEKNDIEKKKVNLNNEQNTNNQKTKILKESKNDFFKSENKIVIRYKDTTWGVSRSTIRSKYSITNYKKLDIGIEIWTIDEDNKSIVSDLKKTGAFEYVEENFKYKFNNIYPNDNFFNDQWALHNTGQNNGISDADVDALEAWRYETGSSNDTVVAIMDTGIDYNHEDLADNMWINEDEIPGNGIDDDSNGYVDDIHGWNFAGDNNDPMDNYGHGTHCAGIIGSVGNNNTGITGINMNPKLMAIKIGNGGRIYLTDILESFDYLYKQEVYIASNSWGGGPYSQALYDAIEEGKQQNVLFIFAAGNDFQNIDETNYYPSGYDLDNIISVASTNNEDELSFYSNYGLESVDLGAPGENIISTLPGNLYDFRSGTSMATPYVAGAASLIIDNLESLPSYLLLKEMILNGVDEIPSLSSKCKTGGRLNINNVLSKINTENILIYPNELDFGDIFVDSPKTESIQIFNNGEEDFIAYLTEDSNIITLSENVVTVSPGSSVNIDVTIKALVDEQIDETIHIDIHSNMYQVDVKAVSYVNGWEYSHIQVDGLDNTDNGDLDFGDYDNDGDMDILSIRFEELEYYEFNKKSQILRNDGDNVFTDINAPLMDLHSGTCLWDDFDNDGDLDAFINGSRLQRGGLNYIMYYRNEGNDTFIEKGKWSIGKYHGVLKLVDFDNDGVKDLFVAGDVGDNVGSNATIFKIIDETHVKQLFNVKYCKTDFDGSFCDYSNSVDIGDFDNDNDIDILIAEENNEDIKEKPIVVYVNKGNLDFVRKETGLNGLNAGDIAWGDYDNDKDLDIAISGLRDGSYGSIYSEIYRYDGMLPNFDKSSPELSIKYEKIDTDLIDLFRCELRWGDVNNDGLLDLIAHGRFSTKPFDTRRKTYIYINKGDDVFIKLKTSMQVVNLKDGDLNISDVDMDGDLDIVTVDNNGYDLYTNITSDSITKPKPGTNLRAEKSGNKIKLAWDAPYENDKLTYNIKVGSKPGGNDLLSSMSFDDGTRMVSRYGNVGRKTYKIINNIDSGIYYWSVQSIDNSYNGSQFSEEGIINVGDIHVSKQGSDETGNGSKSNPYKTIQKAIDSSANQNNIYIAEGIYDENLYIKKKLHIEGGYDQSTWDYNFAQNRTHIRGNNYPYFERYGIDSSIFAPSPVVWIRNKDVVLSSLEISNTGNQKWSASGGIFVHNSKNVMIENTYIHDIGNKPHIGSGSGIYLIRSDNAILKNNTILNNEASGIAFNHTEDVNMYNNIISNNLFGIYVANDGSHGSVTYSDVWNNNNNFHKIGKGTGTLITDPLFDLENFPFLKGNSPCIGTGKNGEDIGAFPYVQ